MILFPSYIIPSLLFPFHSRIYFYRRKRETDVELSGTTPSPHHFPILQEWPVLLHHKLPMLGHFLDLLQFLEYVVHAAIRPYVDRIVELASIQRAKDFIISTHYQNVTSQFSYSLQQTKFHSHVHEIESHLLGQI